jgi:hypothetical protein
LSDAAVFLACSGHGPHFLPRGMHANGRTKCVPTRLAKLCSSTPFASLTAHRPLTLLALASELLQQGSTGESLGLTLQKLSHDNELKRSEEEGRAPM